MAKTVVKVEGLSDLVDALEELPKATGKAVLRRVLLRAGKPIADDAAADARRRSGKLKGSYGVSTKLSRRQRSQNVKGSSVEVFAGPGALVQAITEEFGTSHNAPHPTLRPSWDRNKMVALKIVADDLGEEIMKTAKRRAARIARQQAR